MRITIPTTGSRGDVQPYIALGLGLQAAGHQVRLATHTDFEPLVRSYGLDFYSLEADGRALQASNAGDRMLQAGRNPVAFLREFVRLREPLIRGLMANCHEACRDADVVLMTTTSPLVGYSVAQKLGIPAYRTSLQPADLSRFHPSFLFPEPPEWLPFQGVYNVFSHLFVGLTLWQMWRKTLNERGATCWSFRPCRLPAPAGISCIPRSPWTDTARSSSPNCATGPKAITSPATGSSTPRPAGGRRPISKAFWRPGRRRSTSVSAAITTATPPRSPISSSGRSRRRECGASWPPDGAVWNPSRARTNSIRWNPAPHAWLFPRMAAVAHHGGAGSTAAGLRAGVPSILIPFTSDQPFWGRRVHQLGLGPKPIPRKELTAERLEWAVRQTVADTAIRRRSEEMGRMIRAEDGVGKAVALFQRHVDAAADEHPRHPRPTAGAA